MSRLTCLAFAASAAANLLNAQPQPGIYQLGPDSQPRPGTPKGVVTRHVLPPGKVYPGVPHNYAVYVPAQYDASKPAPFMIFLDGLGSLGNGQRVPVVFDNLIAQGHLPPLIGIFVDPGVLPALSASAQNRFHRILEYDSIDGRFARFLEEELIATVAKTHNLSKDPSHHAIAGVSTGAVGAFVAAWNRPDLFRRVLSFIGTFVNMRGADALPALIRRTEPKPIRVFLEAGRNDHTLPDQPFGTFYAGSWPINNQLMFEALQFAGYDAKLEYGDNAHSMSHGAAIMPDALRWLWRDFPKPVTARAPEAMSKPGWDPRAQVFSVIMPDRGWEAVDGGSNCPAVSSVAAANGRVYFSDAASNRICVADADGKVSVFKEKSGGVTALRAGPDGRLYAAQPASHRIVSYGVTNVADEKVVARDVNATDLALTANGAIYYVDAAAKALGFIPAKSGGRSKSVAAHTMVSPSAVALSPDQSLLLVADAQSRHSWSFQLAPDGSPINGEPFFRLDMDEDNPTRGANGVTVDSIGQAYCATALGIQLCEQNDRCGAILAKPAGRGPLGGIAFGGKDLDILYAIEGNKLFRRPVKTRGVSVTTPIKPPKPPL